MRPAMAFSERDDFLEVVPSFARPKETVQPKARLRYPLLVVFPPAGYNRRGSEIFYDLTTEATRRGFTVAYSDHLSLSPSAVSQQAKVAATVASFFCVDESSIAYLGHSDGGAMAEGIPVYVPKAGAAPRCVVCERRGDDGARSCGDWLFRENRIAAGRFHALGRLVDLRELRCPLFLLAGDRDSIATAGQVLAAATLTGARPRDVETAIAPCGHLALFVGRDTLKNEWPRIARWLAERPVREVKSPGTTRRSRVGRIPAH